MASKTLVPTADTAVIPSAILTASEAAAADTATLPERQAAAWQTFATLPDTATTADRVAALTAAWNVGADIVAADTVTDVMAGLDRATDIWRHSARVVEALSRQGLTIPAIGAIVGLPDAAARNNDGKRIVRMVRAWRLALAGSDTGKSGNVIRPYIVLGNVIQDGQMADAAAALKSGKGPSAVLADIKGARAISVKDTGTPRVGGKGKGKGKTADAPTDAASGVAVGPDALAAVTADTLAGMTDAGLTALAVKVARALRGRTLADREAADALASVLADTVAHISPVEGE